MPNIWILKMRDPWVMLWVQSTQWIWKPHMKVRTSELNDESQKREWWAKPNVYWLVTHLLHQTQVVLQENKGNRATFQGIRECWFWERPSFSVRCPYSLSCLTWAESAIHGLSLKYQIPPFLLTNTLHCSEIPHPGHRGRHGCVFFKFVEVDNELSHLVTTVFCVPFFFWISVLCHIVCSSGCECTWQNGLLDLCPVPHCAFKQMWVHLTKWAFGSLSCAALCIQVDVSALDKMGFWISVLCCILHSSRCEHTLQPLLSWSYWHFARPG